MTDPRVITKEETVTSKAHIWAMPNRFPKEGDTRAFVYEIYTSPPYTAGAVNVCEIEIEGEVTPGINLVERALATLEEKQEEIRRRAAVEVAEVQKEISDLLRLTFMPPEPEFKTDEEDPAVEILENVEFEEVDDIPGFEETSEALDRLGERIENITLDDGHMKEGDLDSPLDPDYFKDEDER